MMKRIGYLAGVIQILMMAAIAGLEFLSGKRGGINHHVLARKHQWSQGLLSTERLQQLDILLGVTALILIALLVRACVQPTSDSTTDRSMPAKLLLALCFSALTFFSYRLPFFQQLRTSSYATLTFAAATFLQLGVIIVVNLSNFAKK